ncbi:hypothetical protein TorRG33x02_049840 [Trema orientale]|uniref:Uncharacterized protein n=1 Tax=Trema orientale TaxID=63057 RepID=A0A2P5FMX0_TREOI|nr:hypothetical protein TorRG33x02_049840 [Trema orientale]
MATSENGQILANQRRKRGFGRLYSRAVSRVCSASETMPLLSYGRRKMVVTRLGRKAIEGGLRLVFVNGRI